jgi:hypothetical protein
MIPSLQLSPRRSPVSPGFGNLFNEVTRYNHKIEKAFATFFKDKLKQVQPKESTPEKSDLNQYQFEIPNGSKIDRFQFEGSSSIKRTRLQRSTSKQSHDKSLREAPITQVFKTLQMSSELNKNKAFEKPLSPLRDSKLRISENYNLELPVEEIQYQLLTGEEIKALSIHEPLDNDRKYILKTVSLYTYDPTGWPSSLATLRLLVPLKTLTGSSKGLDPIDITYSVPGNTRTIVPYFFVTIAPLVEALKASNISF